jgi:rare lipoprotein A
MANGKPLNDSAMTCAVWNIPFGRKLRVRNLANGRTVIVTVTDRGPGKRSRSRGVIVDLTPAAMRALAGEDGINAGRVRVELEDK